MPQRNTTKRMCYIERFILIMYKINLHNLLSNNNNLHNYIEAGEPKIHWVAQQAGDPGKS